MGRKGKLIFHAIPSKVVLETKQRKQDHASMGQKLLSPEAHLDGAKGAIILNLFYNAAPGTKRLKDHNQLLLPYKCYSLDSPVLLSSFKVMSANLSKDVSAQHIGFSTFYPSCKYKAHCLNSYVLSVEWSPGD